MTKEAFITNLLGRGFVHATYNTNNAWGFGGGIGDQYTKGETVVKVGTAYFRHMAPARYITVTVDRKRIVDATPSTKVFDRAFASLGL